MTAASAEAAPKAPTRACYVYGVVSGSEASVARLRSLPAVASPESRVTLIPHRGIAAVVSEVPTDQPLGTPEDLEAHSRVLDTLAATPMAVLPFRFGTVVPDRGTVTDELLTNGHDDFVTALDRLAGRVQFTLRARYGLDTVLREVVEEQPQVRELRESLAGLPEEIGHGERIQLGELVSQALAAKRRMDAGELEQQLGPFADAMTSVVDESGEGVVDASFLIQDRRREDFENAAEELARRWHGRISLRLLGPLAAYDFVDEALSDIEGGR